jgi:hypothetical protein
MHGTRRQNCRPTGRDFESVVADSKEAENARCNMIDARYELFKVFALMQRLLRLPCFARHENWEISPEQLKHRHDSRGYNITHFRLERCASR